MSFECPHCGSAFLGEPRSDRCPSCGLALVVGAQPAYERNLQWLYGVATGLSYAGWFLLVASVVVVIWLGAEIDPDEPAKWAVIAAAGIPLVALSLLVIAAGVAARLTVLARRLPPRSDGE